MSWSILRTDKFSEQLQQIIWYIADDSGSTVTALRYLDRIEDAVLKLEEYPETGIVPRYASLKRRGFRILCVERHLVFYKIDRQNSAVILYAIFDSRREYVRLL